jgi:hypothetical protein
VREGPDHGVFIKDIAWGEMRSAGAWEWATNSTPLWFAEGTFTFSQNNQLLIHKTRWGEIVRINLQDGSVSKE